MMKKVVCNIIQKFKRNTLLKDSFWAIMGSVLGRGLALIAGIAIARFLGKDVYGEYGMIKSNLVLISTFSTFGLGYTATKFIAQNVGKNNSVIYSVHHIATKITLIFSSLLAFLVFVFAEPFAEFLEGEHLANLFRYSAIAIIFNALTTTQIGELAGLGKYKAIAMNNTYVGIFTFIVSVLLSYSYGIEGAAVALILSFCFNCLINRVSLSRNITYRILLSSDKYNQLTKEILLFSFPVALQESTYSITSWLTMLVLVKLSNYGEVGLNAVANQWFSVVLFIPGALRNVALSHLSGSADDSKTNKLVLKRLLLINFVFTFIPFLIISIFSSIICKLYGSSYIGLQPVLIVCTFNSVINSITNILTQELMAQGRNWYLFFSRIGRDMFTLALGVLLITINSSAALMLSCGCVVGQMIYAFLLFNLIKRI